MRKVELWHRASSVQALGTGFVVVYQYRYDTYCVFIGRSAKEERAIIIPPHPCLSSLEHDTLALQPSDDRRIVE